MPKFDNFPAYFEELTLKEETTLSLSDLISQLKQQIPVNFVYLEVKERNYQCSTTGWKEPVCERYGFTYENKWIQLDIPHSLLAKLGLKKGEDLPASFYLAPHLLKKEVETTQGGITLQEGEIILLDPHKIIIKDQEAQTEPNFENKEEFKKLREELADKNKEIADLRAEKQEWVNKYGNFKETVRSEVGNFDYKGASYDPNELLQKLKGLAEEFRTFKTELAKEKGWWDKWINDNFEFIDSSRAIGGSNLGYYSPATKKRNAYAYLNEVKLFFKNDIYKYYRDK